MGTLDLGRIMRIELPDDLTHHVHAIVIAKLRLNEPILVGWTTPDGHHDELLVHPSMPVIVSYEDERNLGLDRRRLEFLMRAANGIRGLQVTPELITALDELDGERSAGRRARVAE
ncbi:DUF7882 family protein [Agromyces litoreus]|uniref:DUF7882 family protein n=1 Tax=Agromyces litoreus TaxID=3158561 RepID=UPI00339987F0